MFDKEWLESYFEHGIDVPNRRVFLDSDIDGDSIGAAVRGLYLMETESASEPVEIFISSYGGEIYEALGIYDIIRTIKCPVHTFAYGKCMSAAPLLLALGEPGHRWVAPHVSLMHHDWSCELDGRGTALKVDFDQHSRVNQQWVELLAKHSCKDVRWWNTRAKKPHDFYFTADEAIEWGLADNIWEEK